MQLVHEPGDQQVIPERPAPKHEDILPCLLPQLDDRLSRSVWASRCRSRLWSIREPVDLAGAAAARERLDAGVGGDRGVRRARRRVEDDRLGRALDAVADRLDHIVGSVGAAAIDVFGLDMTRMHWDMSSISLHGTYERAEEGLPTPRFGHPKDRRPDLRQIQAGIAVSADGGVPVHHRAFDGGAGEVSQVGPAMKALQELAGPPRMLMIGDSKLISHPNLAAMTADKVGFIAPAGHVGLSRLGTSAGHR
jgi:hypothetical protein